MIVYVIRNTVNNKVYIGKTIRSLKRRWYQHQLESKDLKNTWPVYRAIRKHGIENFLVEILAVASTLTDLNALEIKFIRKFRSREKEFGYNIRAGGEGGALTEEGLEKLRISHRTPEFRAKQSATMKGKNKGKKRTEEWKLAASERNKGEGNPMFGKTPWLARHHTSKTKKLLSDQRLGSLNPQFGKPGPMRGKKHTKKTIQRLRDSHQGQQPTEATREKLRKAQQLRRQKEREPLAPLS